MVCSQWPCAEAVLGMPKMVSVVCDEVSFRFSSTALYTCNKSDLIGSHKERYKSFGTPSSRGDLCFAPLLTAVFSSCYETSSTQGHIAVASQLPIAFIRSVCTTRGADASVNCEQVRDFTLLIVLLVRCLYFNCRIFISLFLWSERMMNIGSFLYWRLMLSDRVIRLVARTS